MLLWVLCLSGLGVRAVIYQISAFGEISGLTSPHHAPNETLFLFDLDNTLMAPSTDVGSDQWFYCLYQTAGVAPLANEEVDSKLVRIWNQVQHTIVVEPTEPELAGWIRSHQELGYRTMALTARSFNMLDVSVKQLDSIGIRLHGLGGDEVGEDLILAKELLGGREEARFSRGVLAVGESNVKATALQVFLRHHHQQRTGIRKIVFVDDKHYHCEAMDQITLDDVVIESYRYGKLDERVSKFQCNREEAARHFLLSSA